MRYLGIALLSSIFVITVVLFSTGEAKTPDDLAAHIDIRLPEGVEGPVPVALLFSGCGGVRSIQDEYAETALENGWAAAIVDSHKARGIGRLGSMLTVCTALRLRGAERAEDVFAALNHVRADTRLDGDRIAVAGWSHGGWALLDAFALAAKPEANASVLAGVQAAYLVYPYCGRLTLADTHPIGDSVDIDMVLAGRDRVVSAEACRRVASARGEEGTTFTVIEEPDLTHAFDAPDQPADPRMRYDAEGAARAHTRFAEMLSRVEG